MALLLYLEGVAFAPRRSYHPATRMNRPASSRAAFSLVALAAILLIGAPLLHAALDENDVEQRHGFRVTRPLRAIANLAGAGNSRLRWAGNLHFLTTNGHE